MANPFVTQYLYDGIEEARSRSMPFAWLACRDGWVGIYLHVHLWQALCEALDLAELAGDPRFAPAKARLDNWKALQALLQAHVAEWSTAEIAAMAAAGTISAVPA